MKKVFVKTMAFAVVFSMTVSGISLTKIKAEEQNGSEETKSYIIVTKNDSSFEVVSEEYDDTISDTAADYVNLEDENILITEMTQEEAEDIGNESGVLIVEEDTTVYAQTNDPEELDETPAEVIETSVESVDEEWNMEMINSDVPEADQIQDFQTKIKVALIDSGLDVTENIDVAGRINLVPGEEELLPLFEDTTGHGTFIAGIISANNDYEYSDVKGINDQVELYSAKVLDYTNSAPISRVIEGIYWAISQDVDIINLSFGTNTNSAALHAAIQDAYNEGILIIAASGNSGGAIEYPAAYSEVMAVGSVDSNGIISDFCSTGEDMEVVAPGELIKSTGGFGGELIESGTSMAVPHVVGVASILWQKDPTKSADFVRQLINESANCLGDENIYGNGLVDLEYALEIYDSFSETYVPNTAMSNELSESDNYFENDEEVTGFDDVSYVEGRWYSYYDSAIPASVDNHMKIAEYANNYLLLTVEQLYYVKWGAILPDLNSDQLPTSIPCVKGEGENPEFHGYYNNNNNYLVAYDYLSNSARAGSGASAPPNAKIYNYTNCVYNVYGDYYGKYVMLGVAIHCGSDIFAHSTIDYKKTTNTNDDRIISHTHNDSVYELGADIANVVPERYLAAKLSASFAVRRFFGWFNNTPRYDIYCAWIDSNSTNVYGIVKWSDYCTH